ncbi:MAG: hypothetical protein HY276_03630 [Ignavibacteriales bacterium]|nr:hypothetical protein [Ignavibacteriales bacterium]
MERQYKKIKQSAPPFKRCPLCGKEWKRRSDFLKDRKLVLNGYQWNIKKVRSGEHAKGLLVFTHREKECGTSIAVWASQFGKKKSVEGDIL